MIQDQDPAQQPPENQAQKFLKYFSLFMTMVYPAFGIYLLLSSPEQIALDSSTKIILGIMLILYGLFRFYRTYQRFFRKRKSGRLD